MTLLVMYALEIVASGVTLEIRLQGLRGDPFGGSLEITLAAAVRLTASAAVHY